MVARGVHWGWSMSRTNPGVRINLIIPPDELVLADRCARREGLNRSEMIRLAMTEFCRREKDRMIDRARKKRAGQNPNPTSPTTATQER